MSTSAAAPAAPPRPAPQKLSGVAAQQPQAVQQLRAAWQAQRLYSAYLLVSPQQAPAQGLAWAFTQSLLCAAHTTKTLTSTVTGTHATAWDACGLCSACMKVAVHSHPDVHRLMPTDKSTIALQAVRSLCERLSLRPSEAAWKVVIISPAHALGPAAQNALLKTLEEPPGDTLFLLLCRSRNSLLPTIVSRCQSLTLKLPSEAQAAAQLAAAGVATGLAAALAPVCGNDLAQATALQEAGAAEALQRLQLCCQPTTALTEVFALAADLGRDKAQYELALCLFEVLVRNSLILGLEPPAGGTMDLLPAATLPPTLPPQTLQRLAQRLTQLRSQQALNLNRSMALSGLLLLIHAAGLPDACQAATLRSPL
jgi:DNA polymerase-3 subunit delta'